MPITQGAAIAPFPYDETLPGWFTPSGSSVGTANHLIAHEAPNRPDALTVAYLSWYVVATGGNVRGVLLTYEGGVWTVRAMTPSTAVAAINTRQKVAVSSPYTIPAGVRRYYGLTADGTTATFGRPPGGVTSIADDVRRTIVKASGFSLNVGDSFQAADLTTGTNVHFWVRGTSS